MTCPALPGLVTEGDTLGEAREMVRGYLESLRADGLPVPSGPDSLGQVVKKAVEVELGPS